MKFKQIANGLFQIGILPFAVLRNSEENWSLAHLRDGAVFLAENKLSFRIRKYAGELFLKEGFGSKTQEQLVSYFDTKIAEVAEFGEAKKRPKPPEKFLTMLRNL